MNKISGFILYMLNAIKPIQQNQIYKVNPVGLYGRQQHQSAFEQQMNFNLNQPNNFVLGKKANHLDFLA